MDVTDADKFKKMLDKLIPNTPEDDKENEKQRSSKAKLDVAVTCGGFVLGAGIGIAILVPGVLPAVAAVQLAAALTAGGVSTVQFVSGCAAVGCVGAIGTKYALGAASEAVNGLVVKRRLSKSREKRIETLKAIFNDETFSHLARALDLLVKLWERDLIDDQYFEQKFNLLIDKSLSIATKS